MNYSEYKEKAIKMRRKGGTYSEILKVIPVAKSTLSLWLRNVGLSKPQQQRITENKKLAQKRGALVKSERRKQRTYFITQKAINDIAGISNRDLWLIGIALYWAEGAKEKVYGSGCRVSFSNSDPYMVKLFLKWLIECVNVSSNKFFADIYIHESSKSRIDEVVNYWCKLLDKPESFFRHIYYKKDKINTKRKNVGNLYNGLIRVNIVASSDLNRKIAGWVKGICRNCGIV